MATDYSLNLKANLDTAEVKRQLDDLRSSGTAATSELETAVKRLDNAVQDLTRTWEKQAEAAAKAAENAEEAAKAGTSTGGEEGGGLFNLGGLIGGALNARRLKTIKKLIEELDNKDGSMSDLGTVSTTGLSRAAQGMLVGKTPAAALAGAIAGVVEGFEDLKDRSKAAANAIQAKADAERKAYKDLITGETQRFAEEDIIESLKTASAEDLQKYIDTYGQKRAAYRSRIQEGALGGESDAEFVASMSALQEDVEKYKTYSELAQKELDKRAKAEKKAAEAAEKKAQQDAKEAARQEKAEQREQRREQERAERLKQDIETYTSRWTRDEQMKQFKADLETMGTSDLLDERSYLEAEATRRTGMRDDFITLARNLGDEHWLAKAKEQEEYLKDAQSKIGLIDNILGNPKSGASPLTNFLLGPSSSQAEKGYDVGGYGGFASIEQNQLAKQIEIAAQAKATSETLKQTQVITTNLYSLVMNRFMGLNGSNSATWKA